MANVSKQTVLTDEGLQKLKNELEYLKTDKRQDIADKIKVALSFGDLSENSEYDEAKNEQGIIEARIAELEATLSNYTILKDDQYSKHQIHLGSKFEIYDEDLDETEVYMIVGSIEADPMNGKISDESPVGVSLLGHVEGDVVPVETPDGTVNLKIVKILA